MGSLADVADNSPFTLDNIPFGVFSTKDDSRPRCATAIGEFAVDLGAVGGAGLFSDASVTDALAQVWKTLLTMPVERGEIGAVEENVGQKANW
jgi:hypothetical protein